MNSTATQRRLYAPPCDRGPRQFRSAYEALNAVLLAFRYGPESGHTGSYVCRPITGGSNYSLHAYPDGDAVFVFWTDVRVTMALAVDINWRRNPYGPRLITDMPRPMVDAVLAIRTNSGAQVWGWGGNYARNKDAMHFEVVCGPADLASGIDPRTVRGASVPPPPQPEEDDVFLYWHFGAVYLCAGIERSASGLHPDIIHDYRDFAKIPLYGRAGDNRSALHNFLRPREGT